MDDRGTYSRVPARDDDDDDDHRVHPLKKEAVPTAATEQDDDDDDDALCRHHRRQHFALRATRLLRTATLLRRYASAGAAAFYQSPSSRRWWYASFLVQATGFASLVAGVFFFGQRYRLYGCNDGYERSNGGSATAAPSWSMPKCRDGWWRDAPIGLVGSWGVDGSTVVSVTVGGLLMLASATYPLARGAVCGARDDASDIRRLVQLARQAQREEKEEDKDRDDDDDDDKDKEMEDDTDEEETATLRLLRLPHRHRHRHRRRHRFFCRVARLLRLRGSRQWLRRLWQRRDTSRRRSDPHRHHHHYRDRHRHRHRGGSAVSLSTSKSAFETSLLHRRLTARRLASCAWVEAYVAVAGDRSATFLASVLVLALAGGAATYWAAAIPSTLGWSGRGAVAAAICVAATALPLQATTALFLVAWMTSGTTPWAALTCTSSIALFQLAAFLSRHSKKATKKWAKEASAAATAASVASIRHAKERTAEESHGPSTRLVQIITAFL